MNHSGNENLFLLNSVDHTVAVGQQLPNALVIKLRNFSPERGNRDSTFVWLMMVRTTPVAYTGES